MQIDEIEWPEDLSWAEDQVTDATEERVRAIALEVEAENDPPTRRDLSRLFDVLDARLFAGSPSPIAGRMRIITRLLDPEVDGRGGIAIRFRWTAPERTRRAAEITAAHAASVRAGDRGSSDSNPSDLVAKAFQELAAMLAGAIKHAELNPAARDLWELAAQHLKPVDEIIMRARMALAAGD